MSEAQVEFSSYDGLKLQGTFRKNEGVHLGNMLFVHGIFASRDEDGFYTTLANRLAEIGVASLRFDFRCHGVNTLPFENLSLAGIVNDIDAAFGKLEQVANQASKNFVFASSFGGGVSAFWAKRNGIDKINTVFLLAPVISYEWDVRKTSGKDLEPQLASVGYVDYVNHKIGRALVNEMPYINGIDAVSSPIFNVVIFHGTADDDVPLASSEKYLCKTDKCKLITIPDAGHGLVAPGEAEAEGPLTRANYEIVFDHVIDITSKVIKS